MPSTATFLRQKSEGVETIIILIHQGDPQRALINEAANIESPLEDIINYTDDEVDSFITGHTHQSYITTIDGRPMTQARYNGMVPTDLHLLLSRKTRDVIEASARNISVTHNIPGDPEVGNLVRKYKSLTGPYVDHAAVTASSDITRELSPS